jgi:16S rRNA (guanine966-N2)-methyltransferase
MLRCVRIIAGKAGRMSIQVPTSVTRPTTDFVRQALFSILSERVEDARVLDLFAGSGALGLEALSRGAASCVFVEQHRQAASIITKNLAKTKLTGGRVATSAVEAFLKKNIGTYDIILADPPYWKYHGDADEIGKLFASGLVVPQLADDGWFVAEASSAYRAPEAEGLILADRRAYGSSALLFYQKQPINE